MGDLVVDDLIGGLYHVQAPGQSLGRSGDIVIGEDDPYMHRKLLGLWCDNGVWFATNLGTRASVCIEPLERPGFTRTTLGIGATTALYFGRSAIVFRTPVREYEIHTVAPVMDPPAELTSVVNTHPPTEGFFVLNKEQAALLNALSEPLRNLPGATAADVPTINQVATALGWTEKKTNTKLDYLYKRLQETGAANFPAFRGVALPRRITLAFFALGQLGSLKAQG